METLYQRCAGLDIGKKIVVACVLSGTGRNRTKEIRTFSTITKDLLALADWLRSHQVEHVAMESTWSYWKPIWNILEGEFPVTLVNPQHIKAVPGRKADVKDAEWIADLLQHGLLTVPDNFAGC